MKIDRLTKRFIENTIFGAYLGFIINWISGKSILDWQWWMVVASIGIWFVIANLREK